MASKSRPSSRVSALAVTPFAHLLAVAVIALVLAWLLHFREGVAFHSHIKPKIFNLHPLLMVIGFLLISGEAIMAYKSVPAERKTKKMVHLILHFIALLAGIVGVYAVFKYHHEIGTPDLYTLHSWIGISTICLFGIQWLFAFFSFWLPVAEKGTRAKIVPWHSFFGIVIFFMAILSAEMGLAEKFTFLKLRHGQEALVMNFTGLLILLFAISVGLTVLLP
ncbi:hypothetical protein U1Q18_029766 [Sarracenia purpurea var. burkii]